MSITPQTEQKSKCSPKHYQFDHIDKKANYLTQINNNNKTINTKIMYLLYYEINLGKNTNFHSLAIHYRCHIT